MYFTLPYDHLAWESASFRMSTGGGICAKSNPTLLVCQRSLSVKRLFRVPRKYSFLILLSLSPSLRSPFTIILAARVPHFVFTVWGTFRWSFLMIIKHIETTTTITTNNNEQSFNQNDIWSILFNHLDRQMRSDKWSDV